MSASPDLEAAQPSQRSETGQCHISVCFTSTPPYFGYPRLDSKTKTAMPPYLGDPRLDSRTKGAMPPKFTLKEPRETKGFRRYAFACEGVTPSDSELSSHYQ